MNKSENAPLHRINNSKTMIKQSKKLKQLALVLIMPFILSSCEKEEELNNPDNASFPGLTNSMDASAVAELLTIGNGLRITRLTDEEEDETYLFDSYLFVFNTDGTVSATDAGKTVNGSYAVFRDDGKIELSMSFPNDPSFRELNDDWYFISFHQNLIRFDDSGDRLEFQQQ